MLVCSYRNKARKKERRGLECGNGDEEGFGEGPEEERARPGREGSEIIIPNFVKLGLLDSLRS